MSIESFTYAKWIENGEHEETVEIRIADFEEVWMDHFRGALKNLSGDLELPYESSLSGEVSHCDYRIVSDLKGGAYVMFYFHGEIAMLSVMLQGNDEHHETRLLQTIKCLLLDPEDDDEAEDLTDEELDELLASELFDFDSVAQRPAMFSVLYDLEPAAPIEMAFIEKMNLHMAAAFMEMGH